MGTPHNDSVTRTILPFFLMIGMLANGTPSQAREALGTFGEWAAFRDARPHRCYAIAEPSPRPGGKWRAFASVANWPDNSARSQLHIRLRSPLAINAPVTLIIGDQRFTLVGGKVDAWAPDTRSDSVIVAAIRSASNMRIEAKNEDGKTMADHYPLRGAATAIDAAALACAR